MDHEKCTEILAWAEPPEKMQQKIDRVYAELKARPDQWALIYSGQWKMVLWYAPFGDYPDVEVRTVYTVDNPNPFSPRDVYARYTGGS